MGIAILRMGQSSRSRAAVRQPARCPSGQSLTVARDEGVVGGLGGGLEPAGWGSESLGLNIVDLWWSWVLGSSGP